MRVLVCQPATENMRVSFARKFPEHEFIYDEHPSDALLASAEAIFGCPEPERLGVCTELRFMQLSSAGAERYKDAAPAAATLCCASGAFGGEMGEVLLAYLLALKKQLPQYRDRQLRREWSFRDYNRPVAGSSVLIVGLGDIGMGFARLLKPLGCRVAGVRRSSCAAVPDCVDELHAVSELDALLPDFDVVALCLPHTAETSGLMSRERIFAMKPGAVLLNVGRGSAVDTGALCDALESGRLSGAALDVVSPEPLPPEHRLWGCENAIITPHVAGKSFSPDIIESIGELFERNFAAFLAKKPLVTPVDRETGYMQSRR